jgi:hypothetical protein
MNNKPVAWINLDRFKDEALYLADCVSENEVENMGITTPLYTHPAKTLSIGEIHAVWAAGKYYELDKDGQVDEIKFTEFAYAILKKASEK